MTDDPENRENALPDEAPEVQAAAERLVAGESVDWTGLESSASTRAAREVLARLKQVEAIEAFHRAGQRDGETLGPGSATWGSLTLIEEIGRGSSGRVFRARDHGLDRDVALKILEPGSTGDSPQTTQAIEEGRCLARLRHPNVVRIHGADRVDGRVGLEMELVEGQTLADLVQSLGPLSADEAALVGRDVCRAVAAVHRAGLVHRDIKAQNVIREAGGRIVLMDLGAGRRIQASGPDDVAGTPLYLAPEVLAGEPHTARSDLYSIGVLLYHLVTASFPVTASSLEGLRAAHQSGTVVRLRDARPDLPEGFIRIVSRALERDAGKRFESAGQLEAELSQLIGHRPPATTAGTGWRRVSVAAIVWAIAASLWAAWPRLAPPGAGVRFHVPFDGHLTIPHGPGSREFAVSPDGMTLVYSTMDSGRPGEARIEVRRMDEVASRVLTSPGGQPFFSPDGTRIGMFGKWLTASSLAGSDSVTLFQGTAEGGGAWGPDGTIVFSSEGNVWRIPEAGGTPVRLTNFSDTDDRAAIRPQVLPNGDILLTLREGGGLSSRVAVLTRGGAIRTLVEGATSGRYLPQGYLVFVAGNPPWITAARFDARSLSITSRTVQVQAVERQSHWFDVSASGTLAFTVPEELSAQDGPRLVWVDRTTGREEPGPAGLEPGRYHAYSLRLSPNGRYLAYTTPANPLIETVDQALPGLLTIADLRDGGTGVPLSDTPVHPLAWSRDNTRITYRTLSGAIAWRRIDGTGPEELLASPHPELKHCNSGDWSPDGRVLMLGCGSPTGAEIRTQFTVLEFPSGATPSRSPVVPKAYLVEYGQGGPSFSDDGRWIASSPNLPRGTPSRVVVRAFPGPGPTHVVSQAVGRFPIWRGNELFYMSPYPTAVRTRTGPTFSFDRLTGGPDWQAYDILNAGRTTFEVSPDGRRFLMLKMGNKRGGDYLTRITIVPNWVQELERLLAR